MENISTNKNKIKLINSFIVWIIGVILFALGMFGTFNPSSPSPELFYILLLISMPISLAGVIMIIVNGIRYIKNKNNQQ